MDCSDARPLLLDLARDRVVDDAVRAHVATCAACTAALERERALDGALGRLPTHTASTALRARLEAMAPVATPPRRRGWIGGAAAAVAIAAAAALVLFAHPSPAPGPMVHEAVNDHLRVLHSDHPLDVVASDMHQVKPWLTAHLDFAPALSFLGDDDFPLAGGAVGYFVDRPCAIVQYHRRLHVITLIIVPVTGLDWPTAPTRARDRGFDTLLWTDGDLGYALISDASPDDLAALQTKISPPR